LRKVHCIEMLSVLRNVRNLTTVIVMSMENNNNTHISWNPIYPRIKICKLNAVSVQ
jgi:hypothetical protein